MISAEVMVSRIYRLVATPNNYEVRPYPTIGGMWTVDTYRKDGVVAQLMDDGYTIAVKTDDVSVSVTGTGAAVFHRGDHGALQVLFESLFPEQKVV